MRARSRFLPLSILVLSLCLSIFVLAPRSGAANSSQDPPTPPAGGGGAGQDQPQRPGGRDQQPEIRPYERVITKEAKSDEGIFTVHTLKDKTYYEIPKSELNKEFLWVSQID